MLSSRTIAALGLCLALTSCADYRTADLKLDVIPAEQIARDYLLDPEWWTAYGDADLDALMRTALARNVNLARSAVAVNRALYNARLIGADLLPVFSGEASAGSDKNLATGDAGRSYQSRLGVSYELDLWQRLRNAASAQEWEYLATREDLETARLALLNSVADAYFDLRYLNEAIVLTEASVERYARLLTLTESKYTLGKVASVEPLQAAQSLLAARNNLLQLENSRKSVEQTLRDLLDARPGEALAVRAGGLMDAPVVGVNLDVPVAALAARPDIRAAEDRLQKAFKTVQSNRASWYPTVTLGSTLRATSDTSERFFDVPLLGGTVQISFPFLDWNTLRWQIKISEADFETAKLNFIETVTAALNEVDAARYAWSKSLQTLAVMAEKYGKDMAVRDYYQTRYELGAAELKDYLDAQNTVDSSLLSALEAKYRTIRAENLVFKAMGGRYVPKPESGQTEEPALASRE